MIVTQGGRFEFGVGRGKVVFLYTHRRVDRRYS
jgi:hypothetical protein